MTTDAAPQTSVPTSREVRRALGEVRALRRQKLISQPEAYVRHTALLGALSTAVEDDGRLLPRHPATRIARATDVTPATVCAGLPIRGGALLIDAFLLAFPAVVVWIFFPDRTGVLIDAALIAVYSIVCWTLAGATAGKAMLGLRIVKPDGRRIDFVDALIRYVSSIISLLPAGIGYWWAIWDPLHETWHDKLAGTKVIRVPEDDGYYS